MAVGNIENWLMDWAFDLYTEVVNWEEIKDLRLHY